MLETQGSATNERTQVLVAIDLVERSAEAHRAAFLRGWPRIRPALTSFGKRGFLVVAQRWRGGGDGEEPLCLELPLEVEQSVHCVIGRHTRADLVLRGDASVSLRHLLLTAWLDGARPALRVLDTGTGARFKTEYGATVAAMRADGTCFLSVGTWNLMAIYSEADTEWPEDGETAWQRLPLREAVDANEQWDRPPLRARAYPQLRPATETGHATSSTQIIHLADPEHLAMLPPDSPLAVGALFLPGRRSVRLSVQALTRGVLIGRYDRCGVDQDLLQSDESISRIHLCLVQDPTGLWAVDMASTNGSRVDGERFRALRLDREASLTLARTTRLRWEMA